MTGKTFKANRRDLMGLSVLVTMKQNGVWGLTSNRWLALIGFRCKTAMNLSRQVSNIQLKVSY